MLTRILLCTLVLAGCGTSRDEARDQATDVSCDWYQACGEIGPGQKYEDRDACEIDVRAAWDDGWPASECDDQIDSEALDTCLSSIENTECGNGLDILNTLLNKCARDEVCGGS